VTASRDRHIVFSDVVVHRVIERAALDRLDEAPTALYTDGAPLTMRASQTHDGRMLAFERVSNERYEIVLKDVTGGAEQSVTTVVSDQAVNPTLAPDGSRISYTVRNRTAPNAGSGYVVDAAGGVPRAVCERCSVGQFLSDSRGLLTTPAESVSLRVIDTNSMKGYDLVRADVGTLGRPTPSPNDRWLAFRHNEGNQGKTYLTRLVGASDTPPPRSAWLQVDEPTTTGRPTGWSPDSQILYLLLDTDGSRCLWAQRVSADGRLVGTPYPARHFHGQRGNTMGTSLGNAISPLGFLYERATVTGNLWRLALPGVSSASTQ